MTLTDTQRDELRKRIAAELMAMRPAAVCVPKSYVAFSTCNNPREVPLFLAAQINQAVLPIVESWLDRYPPAQTGEPE